MEGLGGWMERRREGAREGEREGGGGEAGLKSLSYQQKVPGKFEIKTPAH